MIKSLFICGLLVAGSLAAPPAETTTEKAEPSQKTVEKKPEKINEVDYQKELDDNQLSEEEKLRATYLYLISGRPQPSTHLELPSRNYLPPVSTHLEPPSKNFDIIVNFEDDAGHPGNEVSHDEVEDYDWPSFNVGSEPLFYPYHDQQDNSDEMHFMPNFNGGRTANDAFPYEHLDQYNAGAREENPNKEMQFHQFNDQGDYSEESHEMMANNDNSKFYNRHDGYNMPPHSGEEEEEVSADADRFVFHTKLGYIPMAMVNPDDDFAAEINPDQQFVHHPRHGFVPAEAHQRPDQEQHRGDGMNRSPPSNWFFTPNFVPNKYPKQDSNRLKYFLTNNKPSTVKKDATTASSTTTSMTTTTTTSKPTVSEKRSRRSSQQLIQPISQPLNFYAPQAYYYPQPFVYAQPLTFAQKPRYTLPAKLALIPQVQSRQDKPEDDLITLPRIPIGAQVDQKPLPDNFPYFPYHPDQDKEGAEAF